MLLFNKMAISENMNDSIRSIFYHLQMRQIVGIIGIFMVYILILSLFWGIKYIYGRYLIKHFEEILEMI